MMRAWIISGLAALLVALGTRPLAARQPLPEMPDYVFVVAPWEENLDVVIFGDARPALVRFRGQIDGRGFRTAWDEFAGRLYDYLDTNGDRVLTAREAEARPGRWPQLFGNLLPFRDAGPPVPTGDPTGLDSDPKDGKVSVDELSRYLREAMGFEALGSQRGGGPDALYQAAFAQMDRDSDGALSPAELAGAEGLIARLDGDEDEMVALAELRPHDDPFASQFYDDDTAAEPAPNAAESDPIVVLNSAEVRRLVARRLLTRYGGGAFGLADAAALERFLLHPAPSLILDVRLGRAPRRNATLELAGPGDLAGPLAANVKKTEDNGLVLGLDGVDVRLGLNDIVRDFRRFFDMRFNEADADKDGALDRKEAEKSRFFPRLFDPADRDGDETLTRRELTGFLDRSVDATESRLMVTAGDSGRNVFELLDTDHDGRLGRRELRSAVKRLKAFDRDGDGRVALAELPRTYELKVGRGPFFRRRGVAYESYDDPPRRRPGTADDAVSWFRHMDRNHDGDVSAREFLGTAEDFRRLDRDGDGLIDPGEAAKGP
jgi:Ca2+-binding EF-hand superfamily protein